MRALDNSNRRFIVRWTRATALGWALGVPLILFFSSALESLGLSNFHFPVGSGMGLGVGLLQTRLLRKRLERPSLWLCACFAGLTLPFLAADLLRVLGVTL